MDTQSLQKAPESPASEAERKRLYTAGGLWLARNAATGAIRVGLSDVVQRAAGPVLYVELPERGMSIDAGDELANIETAEADLSLTFPVGGTIVALNTALAQAPELINQEPYEAGWLVDLHPDEWPIAGLLDERAYSDLIGE